MPRTNSIFPSMGDLGSSEVEKENRLQVNANQVGNPISGIEQMISGMETRWFYEY